MQYKNITMPSFYTAHYQLFSNISMTLSTISDKTGLNIRIIEHWIKLLGQATNKKG